MVERVVCRSVCKGSVGQPQYTKPNTDPMSTARIQHVSYKTGNHYHDKKLSSPWYITPHMAITFLYTELSVQNTSFGNSLSDAFLSDINVPQHHTNELYDSRNLVL